MTIEQVISEFGGLSGSISFFGWQGGTIHQIKNEWVKRLRNAGHVIRKDGEICDLIITKAPCCSVASKMPCWMSNIS